MVNAEYQNPFSDDLANIKGLTQHLKASHKRCIVCGNKTGDCSTTSAGPKHIVTLGKDEELARSDEIIVEEDVWQETEISAGVWSKTLVARAGSRMKKQKAIDLGII